MKFRISILAAACCLLSGCFNIEGVHVIHYYGDSDTGAYRIKMNDATWAMMQSGGDYSKMLQDLRSWSRPTTREDGDNNVYLEDTSGNASMEHFYDVHSCTAAPVAGYWDCHFAFRVPQNLAELPNWSVDWEVVVQPGMTVLASNNQRTRSVDGLQHLVWYYDGNQVSSATVDFTVRTPRAR